MTLSDSPDAQFARFLAHPLRTRVLQLLAVRGEASPVEMASELGVTVGTLSYHTRLLRDAGWIELVRTEPRRGAVEHFYRAVVRPVVDDARWERLPLGVRRRLAATTVGQILRGAADAAAAGGFDHPQAHVDRFQLELDEEAWQELSELLITTLESAQAIQERSNARRSSREPGAAPPSVLAILHYSLDETP
jgi:DNA-binding transcriptional ArsR family regulator